MPHPLHPRQIHLDFHTSEHIAAVGHRFSPKQFQRALKLARANSITLFAKCHHSWSYYPTAVGRRHPNLKPGLDLIGAQIQAAHAIGVRAPVYYTVGWSANDAADHMDWCARKKDGTVSTTKFDVYARPDQPIPPNAWVDLCPAAPGYRELILNQTREICDLYPVDGFFYDICLSKPCFCDNCKAGIESMNLDPDSDADERAWCTEKWARFMTDCLAAVHQNHPLATVFFNGQANMQTPDRLKVLQTHFELEDLPSTWGGYDKLPIRAKLYAKYDKPVLGMTGKFHTQWGEFGGFKHPAALRYEVAAILAYGAGCSIGDQLHPSGEMNLGTCRNIGQAYEYAEQLEEYALPSQPCSNLGLVLSNDHPTDQGVASMLMEEHLDFDVIRDPATDELSNYRAIILTGSRLPAAAIKPLAAYLKSGGRLLALHHAPFDAAGKPVLNIGAKLVGPARFDIDYTAVRDPEVGSFTQSTPFLNYTPALRVKPAQSKPLADLYEPYFSRTYGHYCSHLNTPNQVKPSAHPAALINRAGNVVYLAHPLGPIYHAHGARIHREFFVAMLRRVYDKPTLAVRGLPSAGRAVLLDQPHARRYAVHLLYAPPLQRGRCLVIEDLPDLHNITLELRPPKRVAHARLPLEKQTLKITRAAGALRVIVPHLRAGHQVVTFDYA